MICLSNDIAYSNIRDTGSLSLETAKGQCAFFTLNSRRPSIDYDARFFSTQTTLQKIKYSNFVC